MKSKRINFIVSLTYLLILFPVSLLSQDLFIAKNELTVFKNATSESDSLCTIHINEEVQVLGVRNIWFKKWAKIQTSTGVLGYVHFHNLKAIELVQEVQENNLKIKEASTQDTTEKKKYSQQIDENIQDFDKNRDTIDDRNKKSESNSNIVETVNSDNEIIKNQDVHKIFDDFNFYLICSIVLIFLVFRYRYRRKCSSCKKWGAMKRSYSEKVREIQSHVKKTEQHTDIRGEKHSNTYYIPATKSYYHIHRKCKYCGYKDILVETEKTEN